MASWHYLCFFQGKIFLTISLSVQRRVVLYILTKQNIRCLHSNSDASLGKITDAERDYAFPELDADIHRLPGDWAL